MNSSVIKEAENKINAIEAELKNIGWWSEKPIDPSKMNFKEPFAADTLAYNQWLQFVFIPRVRTIIKENGDFPKQSQVGGRAVREWDYMERIEKAQNLIKLLNEFDDLFNKK
jgi:uncharacterized protein YqcC (DUF446 family)